MRNRVLALLGALAVVLGGAALARVLVAGPAQAGTAEAATEKWTPLRTAYGQPDISGVWSNNTYTPLQRPAAFADKEFFTEEEAAKFYDAAAHFQFTQDPDVHYDRTDYGLDKWQQTGVRPNLRTSLIVDPPDGRLPALTPEGEKRRAVHATRFGRGPTVRTWSLYTRCITGYWNGLPMLKGSGSTDEAGGADVGTGSDGEHQILQTRDYVVILAQSNNDIRIIPLYDGPRLNTTRWFGDSRGRWEGETLVVETTNFNDQVESMGVPIAGTRLVERFTRLDQNTLLYAFTTDDPTTWTRPWSAEVHWPRAEPPLFEFACHETNYGLLGVVKGTRASRGMEWRH